MTGDRAAALWRPPGAPAPTPVLLARLMPAALRLFGGRIGIALRTLATLDRMHPREPHWYLEVLGTDPEHQGKGYGGVTIAPVLDRCDRDGVAAFLESSNERNGFRVIERFDLPGGPPVWRMLRSPA